MSKLVSGVVAASKPILANFLHYGKVELIPPKPSEFGAIKDGIAHVVHQAKSGGWKNLTVKEAWLNSLIAAEITFWFYVGEVIGKRSLIGYEV
ncbi:ATP synthase subunit g, mitochondrial [Diaphorina citri]|uniref:ATP synthase subunit g n=1 Tax=Diaphorina citri TaxID=121845 RepID=Q0PXW4_DIACI|nr:ATP synthase subunit g, mitochondrial [Diaphorina citri]ABG81995.1 putative mitochondrial ATP synthase H+ transporting F0 complex subunit g [Diaphorina citri]KAI5711298.1 hypothetical protein M8J75_015878 [Diaphorina citri]KAI5744921.1 hypothetical protein M8J76_006632 [Diaphorina citri]KAI5750677.1 hypothetical protein M8J77_000319 [Diaphorina citri]